MLCAHGRARGAEVRSIVCDVLRVRARARVCPVCTRTRAALLLRHVSCVRVHARAALRSCRGRALRRAPRSCWCTTTSHSSGRGTPRRPTSCATTSSCRAFAYTHMHSPVPACTRMRVCIRECQRARACAYAFVNMSVRVRAVEARRCRSRDYGSFAISLCLPRRSRGRKGASLFCLVTFANACVYLWPQGDR